MIRLVSRVGCKLQGVHVIVLDGVGRAHHFDRLQARDAPEQRPVAPPPAGSSPGPWRRSRSVSRPFRLQGHLVADLVRETASPCLPGRGSSGRSPPVMTPLYRGERWMLSRMSLWVAPVVWVTKQRICSSGSRVVRQEKGRGRGSPFSRLMPAKSMDRRPEAAAGCRSSGAPS